MFVAGNCILEQTRQAKRWRFIIECEDSGGESSPQLETAFWSERDRHRDGHSPLNVEIQAEIEVCSRKLHLGAKETGTEMEIHC